MCSWLFKDLVLSLQFHYQDKASGADIATITHPNLQRATRAGTFSEPSRKRNAWAVLATDTNATGWWGQLQEDGDWKVSQGKWWLLYLRVD